MKAFWIKVLNIAVICLILFVYQSTAVNNARMAASVDDFAGKLEEQQAEAEAEDTFAGTYQDGTYEGTGTGYKGDIRVEVVVGNGEITSIEVTETTDDAAYFSQAEALTEEILDRQTTEGVDAVSGATFSSNGIIEAVKDALKGAGA